MVKHYVFKAETTEMAVQPTMDTSAPPVQFETSINKKSPTLQRILAKKKHKRV